MLGKIQVNNINLVFIQFYTMQSLFKCLEEKQPHGLRDGNAERHLLWVLMLLLILLD